MAFFFHVWITSHSMPRRLLHSSICPCTLWPLPCLSCCRCCCSGCSCARLLLSCYFCLAKPTVPGRHPVPLPLPQLLAPTILLSVSMELWDLVGVDSKLLFFRVWLMSLSIMPSGFIPAVAWVRTAFLSGWATFIVWMDRGLLVCSSVEGHRECLHSSLTSCRICGIPSESPMILESFTITYCVNFFILKSIKAQKQGRVWVSPVFMNEKAKETPPPHPLPLWNLQDKEGWWCNKLCEVSENCTNNLRDFP